MMKNKNMKNWVVMDAKPKIMISINVLICIIFQIKRILLNDNKLVKIKKKISFTNLLEKENHKKLCIN